MSSEGPSRPSLDPSAWTGAPSWTTVEVLEEAGSTNAVVTERAQAAGRAGAPHGLVVVTEHQTAGRGRLGRSWETPPRAALTFSVLVRPDPAAAGSPWPLLPLLTGVAVVDGIAAAGGPRCGLKWPNDVLVEDLKVGGLLAERIDTPDGPAAVLGVGLNVTTTADELPVPTASSLLLATGRAPDREAVLVSVLERLGDLLDAWARGDSSALLAAYRGRCVTLGRRVRAELPGGTSIEGEAVRIDDDGALVLRSDGGERTVSAGDVVHVRSAG
jgi:BirA family biotin operon repressor/biotin-[acetyl-CoA-carboxylase] ligase